MKMGKWYAAAAVVGVGLAGIAVVMTWGPPESRAWLRDAGVWVAAALAPILTALLTRDADGDGKPDWMAWIFGLLGVGALCLSVAGCGAAAEQHRTLTVITDVADPTYAAAVEGCDAARDFIIAREGTTYAEDRADMDQIHAVCDSIVEGFELLRGSQITARAAIDGGLEAAAQAAIVEALAAWGRLQGLVPQIMRLTSGGES